MEKNKIRDSSFVAPCICYIFLWKIFDSILNPWPPGGGGSDPTPSLGFSWRTSVSLQISTRNLTCLSVHQFYALMSNLRLFVKNIFSYIDFSGPMSCHLWSRNSKCVKKNRQKSGNKAKCKQKKLKCVEWRAFRYGYLEFKNKMVFDPQN